MFTLSFLVVAGSLGLHHAARHVVGAAASVEVVKGSAEARLVIPAEPPSPAPRDPKLDAAYPAVCNVEIAENGSFSCRFAIHVPNGESLPYASRAGRLYALIWGAASRRLGTLASRLRGSPVDVWLTRGGDAGGEQFRSNIYVFDVAAQRSGIEWARELAHEYGHYLLPGASGYTDPESWSNGVLGERLFLRWLEEDMAAGRIAAEEMPYVSRADLDDYCAKQVEPLVDRVRTDGADRALLAGKDRRSMNAFTGLLLYTDRVYGSSAVIGLLDYLPQDASAGVGGAAFLDALKAEVSNQSTFTSTLPAGTKSALFVPAGRYRVEVVGTSAAAIQLGIGKPAVSARGSTWWTVRNPAAAWRWLSVDGGAGAVALHWTRLAP